MNDRLTVHTRAGVIEIPLTGEPVHDELLMMRFAARGGAVLRDDGALRSADPDLFADVCSRESNQ